MTGTTTSRRRGGSVVAAAVVFALTACASGSSIAELGTTPRPFRVNAGDHLLIAVWPDNDLGLGGDYVVAEDGMVYLPLLGGLEVAGLTLAEVRSLLRTKYGEAIKEPVVQVTPKFPVSVLGAVGRPGLYHVTPAETLFDAISLAGGFGTGAKQREVQIIRDGSVIEVDARGTVGGGADLSLHSGDRIIVPSPRWRIDFRDVLFGLQSIALIITLIERLENP